MKNKILIRIENNIEQFPRMRTKYLGIGGYSAYSMNGIGLAFCQLDLLQKWFY